jgi:hypothetical protein
MRQIQIETRYPVTPRSVALGLAVAMAMLAALVAPSAHAAFGVSSFSGQVAASDGTAENRAGAHPASASVSVEFNNHPEPLRGNGVPDADVRNVSVDLPPGFVGNPLAVPRCDEDVLQDSLELACPADTQVGYAITNLAFWGDFYSKVYNMVPPPGKPAQFAMQLTGVVVHFNAKVRSDGDYGLTVDVTDISQKTGTNSSFVEFWGVPADSSHNALRGNCVGADGPTGALCPSAAPRHAFLTNPTHCSGQPLATRLYATPWEDATNFVTASFDHDVNGEAMTLHGCDLVPFDPEIGSAVQSNRPDKPSGYKFDLSIPQEEGLDGIAQGHLRRAVVTLPEGLTVNPASAGGLVACSDAQIGLHSTAPAECPQAARIGSVRIDTPLLEKPMNGAVYIGTQKSDDPESGEMFRLFIVAEGAGVVVKLPGQVRADSVTGRLTATFDENPQLPFSNLELELKDGPRAPLATPATCGEKTTSAELTSWSGKTRVVPSVFAVGCEPGLGDFAPRLRAGSASPRAGAQSPFSLSITKADGESAIAGLRLRLPEGLLATLKGNLGTQVGTATAFAGPGTAPFQLPGKVFLEGPYGDAPLSLRTVVPAVAGPFDLGLVVVRQKLYVDPVTAAVTVVSDPLPTIVKGVPVRLQRLDVNVDKEHFMRNPTSCDRMKVNATITSIAGQDAAPSAPFQATDCESLAFKPKLALSLSGAPPRRGGYPKLTATLTMPKDGANIRKAVVTMPETEFLENAHIRTVCTRVQYAAHQCPKGSIYGYAKAWTPLLDKPLQGPVYLRSSNHILPDLVASLDGQIHIDLAGRIDSVNSRLRSTFWAVPDAPVSKFRLTMAGGRKGLLANNTNLCAASPRADAQFTGHNGKVADSNPKVKVTGCGKKQRK